VPIKKQHPAAFFRDVRAAFNKNVDEYLLMPEDAQKFILDFLERLVLSRADLHGDPSLPPYLRSSSFNPRNGRFEPPRGGFGPPQSINGSFYHSHSNSTFPELHPNIDLNTYESPVPRPPHKAERRRHQRSADPAPVPKSADQATSSHGPSVAAVPTIVITDVDGVEVGHRQRILSAATNGYNGKDHGHSSSPIIQAAAINNPLAPGIVPPTAENITPAVKVQTPKKDSTNAPVLEDVTPKVKLQSIKKEADEEDALSKYPGRQR
jgi:hypothetical protein